MPGRQGEHEDQARGNASLHSDDRALPSREASSQRGGDAHADADSRQDDSLPKYQTRDGAGARSERPADANLVCPVSDAVRDQATEKLPPDS
jgi:hypothetical protein